MATKQININIVEHANTRNGAISFMRDQNSNVQCIVQVELEQSVVGYDVDTFVVTNDILTDGASVLTTQERQDLFNALKKLYDYARDNIPGSTP